MDHDDINKSEKHALADKVASIKEDESRKARDRRKKRAEIPLYTPRALRLNKENVKLKNSAVPTENNGTDCCSKNSNDIKKDDGNVTKNGKENCQNIVCDNSSKCRIYQTENNSITKSGINFNKIVSKTNIEPVSHVKNRKNIDMAHSNHSEIEKNSARMHDSLSNDIRTKESNKVVTRTFYFSDKNVNQKTKLLKEPLDSATTSSNNKVTNKNLEEHLQSSTTCEKNLNKSFDSHAKNIGNHLKNSYNHSKNYSELKQEKFKINRENSKKKNRKELKSNNVNVPDDVKKLIKPEMISFNNDQFEQTAENCDGKQNGAIFGKRNESIASQLKNSKHLLNIGKMEIRDDFKNDGDQYKCTKVNSHISKGKSCSTLENSKLGQSECQLKDKDVCITSGKRRSYRNNEHSKASSKNPTTDRHHSPRQSPIKSFDFYDLGRQESIEDEKNFEQDGTFKDPMSYIDVREEPIPSKSKFEKSVLHSPRNPFQNRELYSSSDSENNLNWSDIYPPNRRNVGKEDMHMNQHVNVANPSKRGLIKMSGGFLTNVDHHVDIEHNSLIDQIQVGQKLLFNPENPSRPLAVMPSVRDTTSSNISLDMSPSKGEPKLLNEDLDRSVCNMYEKNVKKKIDPSLLYNIHKGEMDINYYVSSNQIPQEFCRIMDIRIHLQTCYKQLLATDIRLCQEKNIEGSLWKSLYYVIIEKLREYIHSEPALRERSVATLTMLVEEGQSYLQTLIDTLQKIYNFSLDVHFEVDLNSIQETPSKIKLALYSCQKLLLSLGDLARYKEQYSASPNYGLAKDWYQMALDVNPMNGRPFNQLAIIAVSRKRHLDVLYFYVRSLMASNPFTCARDSLVSMFEDVKRKYESIENVGLSETRITKAKISPFDYHLGNLNRDGSMRQEIWVRPDSGAKNKRTLSQSDPHEEAKQRIEDISKLPPEQIMKQFLGSYLHCQGMLFSRVGLDNFLSVMAKMLDLFQCLLAMVPSRLSSIHLVQIMAVNMFAISNMQPKDQLQLGKTYRSASQDLALHMSHEMFARLCDAIVKVFPKYYKYSSKRCKNNSFSEDTSNQDEDRGDARKALFLPQLAHYMQAAKVWCDWLLYHSDVWNPPAQIIDEIAQSFDTWGIIGELATILKGLDVPPDMNISVMPEIAKETTGGLHRTSASVVLPEDAYLRGYGPLLAAQRAAPSYSYTSSNNKDPAHDWIRIRCLQTCLSEFLCGVEPPVLKLRKLDEGEMLVPALVASPPSSPIISQHSTSRSSDPDSTNSDLDELSEISSPEEDDFDNSILDTPLAATVRLLAKRKKMLERKQHRQRKMQAYMEGSITLEMEVKPRYLVPDTNCFICHMNVLQALTKKGYLLMIPLTVISELDGLSRDACVEKYGGDVGHAVKVREGASNALEILKGARNPSIKCVTSKGSILPSIRFTFEEERDEDLSNDDKILLCCTHFCHDEVRKRPKTDGVKKINREVVLLTEDRNLRIKAYGRDVPTRDLLDFAKWAGVP